VTNPPTARRYEGPSKAAIDGSLRLMKRNFEAAVFRLLIQQINEFARIISDAGPTFWIGTNSPKRGDFPNIAKRYRQPASATFELDLDYLIISEHNAASRLKRATVSLQGLIEKINHLWLRLARRRCGCSKVIALI
jgi:hypothetical protein